MDDNKELDAKKYFSPKLKPKLKMSRYTVMLIPDSADGAKSIELTIDKIARFVVLVLALVIIITALIVSFAVKNYRLRNDSSLQTQIENLQAENSALAAKNDELAEILAESDSKTNELRTTISDLEFQVAEKYIPSIIPYKGSAVMLSNTIAEGALSFTCLESTYVVTTATGTVIDISEDILGTNITIDHGNGYKTKYITNAEVKVKVNDSVDKGDRIAEIMNDDDTFGYIVLLNDKIQDPMDYIEKK